MHPTTVPSWVHYPKRSMCILETIPEQCVMSRSWTDLINHLKRQEKEFLD